MFVIAAVDSKDGFAREGKIPWNIPEDRSFFEALTQTAPEGQQNAVIMGAKTWNSTPAFEGRLNIVVTSGKTPLIEKTVQPMTVPDLHGARVIVLSQKVFRAFVIGGVKLIEEVLDDAETVFLTRLEQDFQCDLFLNLKDIRWKRSNHTQTRLQSSEGKVVFHQYAQKPFEKPFERGENNYLRLMSWLVYTSPRQTRNAITRSVFGNNLNFDLTKFPLITTKKMFFRGIVEELLFFLRGDTNTNHLAEKDVHFWEPNTNREFLDKMGLKYEVGDMGPMYGFQWRHFGAQYEGMNADYGQKGFDQLEALIDDLCKDPNSRRLMMTSLNMAQVKEGVLWPCHGLSIQF
jgi:dihydrofolate reductase/thymidylate synthase